VLHQFLEQIDKQEHPDAEHPDVEHPNVEHPNVENPNVEHSNATSLIIGFCDVSLAWVKEHRTEQI
jgi:hypothetical protein